MSTDKNIKTAQAAAVMNSSGLADTEKSIAAFKNEDYKKAVKVMIKLQNDLISYYGQVCKALVDFCAQSVAVGTGKTAEVAKFLADNTSDRKVLVVVDEKKPELMRATNNLQNVLVVRANYLSVYHILNADTILLSPKALPVLSNWLDKEEA